jgi:hypothetical protein
MVLVPGAECQAIFRNGPPIRTDVTFAIENTHVASVTASGMVRALSYGQTRLRARMSGSDASGSHKLFGERTISVLVSKVPTIRINAERDELYAGEEMSLRISDAAHDFAFVFSSLSPLHVEWSVPNDGIASLLPIYERANVSLSEESSYSCRIVAVAPGATTVTARIRESAYAPLVGLFASIRLVVVEPLRLISPSHILLPPLSNYQVQANRDPSALDYQLLWNDNSLEGGLTLSSDGVLKSSLSHGIAAVMVSHSGSARDLRQVATAVVEVGPVHRLELLPASPVLRSMPVGTAMQVRIYLLNDRAVRFATAAGVQLALDQNNYEAVSASLESSDVLTVRALKPGMAAIRVYVADKPRIDDVIKINVTQIVQPQNPTVHLGGKVVFRSMVRGEFPTLNWISSKPDVVRMDGNEAHAIATGSSTVECRASAYTSSTGIEVVALASVAFVGSAASAVLSNVAIRANESTLLDVPLMFHDQRGDAIASSPGIDHAFHVHCTIEERDWARAEARANAASGQHVCAVSVPPPEERASAAPTQLTLRVEAGDRFGRARVSSELKIQFVSAFLVKGALRDVQLGPKNQVAYVDVLYAGQLECSSFEPRKVAVTKMHTSREGTVTVKIETAHGYFADVVMVAVRNPNTQQEHYFYVSYEGEPSKDSVIDPGIVFTVLAVVIGFVTYSACFKSNRAIEQQQQQQQQQPVTPHTPQPQTPNFNRAATAQTPRFGTPIHPDSGSMTSPQMRGGAYW